MAEANEERPTSADRGAAIARVDWLAVAPWVGLLKTPAYVLGGPWLLAAGVAVLVGPWPEAEPAADFAAVLSNPLAAAARGFTALYASIAESSVDTGLLRITAWSLVGLAVTLLATPCWTLGARTGLREVCRVFGRLAPRLAPTAALVAAPALIAVAALWTVGLVARVDAFAPVIAVAWPLKWIAGLGATVAGLAAWWGWPLAIAAIAVDDADPFDAASRLYAYVLQRPARLAWYVAVAGLVGVGSGALVELVAAGTLAATHRFFEVGHGGQLGGYAASITQWWDGVFRSAVAGYYAAYVASAAVGVYLMLRRDVDGQPIDERASL
jgi:hypothetical protein